MQYHTVPHTAKQNHTVQCSTARCRMVHCMTLHDSTLHYIALHRIPFPSYMHTIRYDTDYRFQNSIQKRNIVGDGCRIKPGMHKWPGEQPANATSQKGVFFCICLEKQLQLSCNKNCLQILAEEFGSIISLTLTP